MVKAEGKDIPLKEWLEASAVKFMKIGDIEIKAYCFESLLHGCQVSTVP